MAMDTGGAKGSLKSDINGTPLVDVMLVLLIIMMLIAPMLHNHGAITLPEAVNTTAKPDTQGSTVVGIDATQACGDVLYRRKEVRSQERVSPDLFFSCF